MYLQLGTSGLCLTDDVIPALQGILTPNLAEMAADLEAPILLSLEDGERYFEELPGTETVRKLALTSLVSQGLVDGPMPFVAEDENGNLDEPYGLANIPFECVGIVFDGGSRW